MNKKLLIFTLFITINFIFISIFNFNIFKINCNQKTSEIIVRSFEYNNHLIPLTNLLKDNWDVLAPGIEYDKKMIDLTFKDHISLTFYPKNLIIKVLQKDKQIIGFITYLISWENTGHIELFAINNNFQRHGYGTQLVTYAINDLQQMGATSINICVSEKNRKAQALYYKLGFKCIQYFTQNKVMLLTKQLTN